MPASTSAVRTATRSVASEMTSKVSPSSLTSSAPASRVASTMASSSVPSAGTTMTPLRLKLYDTEPGSAIDPPLRVTATRTSEAARLRLSVRHSMSSATPPAA
ncbi:Uncharacterised protein [Mycobacteroides abscessus subsp. abscessus]|nr:Uncharacterised protein [Mycobacteroides abscessus subsp. abscessus]